MRQHLSMGDGDRSPSGSPAFLLPTSIPKRLESQEGLLICCQLFKVCLSFNFRYVFIFYQSAMRHEGILVVGTRYLFRRLRTFFSLYSYSNRTKLSLCYLNGVVSVWERNSKIDFVDKLTKLRTFPPCNECRWYALWKSMFNGLCLFYGRAVVDLAPAHAQHDHYTLDYSQITSLLWGSCHGDKWRQNSQWFLWQSPRFFY